MKSFEKPVVEVVTFKQSDVITTSLCYCVECPECAAGSYDCKQIQE